MESWSRLAEELVRAGRGDRLEWEGLTLGSRFQPIYSARRAERVGYEALARATDAMGARIESGALFVAVAGRRGVLLDRICRALHLRNFATRDPGEGKLFINICPEAALSDAHCPGEFADLLRYYGLVPRRVCVEIVEGGCHDEGRLREAVAAYRALGASIAMDDFGTGRSNLDRIVALRPDVVKLDRSIVIQAIGGSSARTMLAPMVRLLHETGAQVAIEGIETADQALLAIEAGADLLQGNYFAAPADCLGDDGLNGSVLRKLWRMRERLAAAAGDD